MNILSETCKGVIVAVGSRHAAQERTITLGDPLRAYLLAHKGLSLEQHVAGMRTKALRHDLKHPLHVVDVVDVPVEVNITTPGTESLRCNA